MISTRTMLYKTTGRTTKMDVEMLCLPVVISTLLTPTDMFNDDPLSLKILYTVILS